MIVNPSNSHLRLFFTLRGSILLQVLPQISGVMAWSAGVVALHQWAPDWCPAFNGTALSLIGIALSVFVGSRNSICYERWWEGRRQFGALVSHSRQFGREVYLIDDADGSARKRMIDLTIAYTQALIPHLRPGANAQKALARLSPADRDVCGASRNPPDALLRMIVRELDALRRAGRLGEISFQTLDRTIGDISLTQAACERLRSTPIPLVYRLLLYRTSYLFLLLLPFGYVESHAWASPVVAGLIAYAFFGLDELAGQLERPFDTHPNGLPIEALAATIEINLRETLGEEDLPALPAPKNHLLM
jgi:putative membrane protein